MVELFFFTKRCVCGGILQDLGVTILSVILRRIILGKNCTALPLEVGARPSHIDHGGGEGGGRGRF